MIIAIDVGLKRIGVATALSQNLVVPSEPIVRKNRVQAAFEISKILSEKKATKLVVGLPKGGASEAEMERRIRHFVGLIEFGGEIVFFDESFSSFESKTLAKDRRDGRFDSIAAMIILKRYLKIL